MTEVDSPADTAAFALLGLDPKLLENLGYDTPSPIQREAIPALLTGRDLVGLAGTGTGKTAAFALPIVQKLSEMPKPRPPLSALILTPTRELAMQVAKSVETYGKSIGVQVLAVYGGTGYGDQIRSIRRGVDVIVATPGRALDLLRQGKLPLSTVTMAVLDEADEMLDMGFAEDIDALLSETPKTRQTMLFSATMPPRIEEIAKRHLRDPIRIAVKKEVTPPGEEAKVRQTAYPVRREHKLAALGRILAVERPTSAIIFCRTRSEADSLTEMLGHRGFRPAALHGGLTQDQRDRVMGRFRAGASDLLIATDIAARGLDISQLSHVVNFDVPPQAEAYVHRIGRVGRAGREGVAISLVSPAEQGSFANIERLIRQKIAMSPVPSAADLKTARIAQSRQAFREAFARGNENADFKALAEDLQGEFTPNQIALAVAALLSPPAKPDDLNEIPSAMPRDFRGGPGAYRSGGPGPSSSRSGGGYNGGGGNSGGGSGPAERKRAGGRPTKPGMAKVFFGIGRDANVAPADLVGAISNEAGIPGKDIGSIDLTDRFALVEVPSDVADYVVEVMQNARIKGRRVNVRPDRPPPRES